MKLFKIACSVSLVLLGVSFTLTAQEELKTDWLKTVEGSAGNVLSAEVLKVTDKNDVTVVDVGFPEKHLKNYRLAVAEDRLTGKKIIQTKAPDLLKDEKDKPYGLRFHLKKVPGFEFRVSLYEETEIKQ